MITEYGGFIVTIKFWGDSITPCFVYRLYKPRKYWFKKLVWTETVHQSKIITHKLIVEKAVKKYENSKLKWVGL